MIQALIVDDELYARSSLFFLIQEHCPAIDKIFVAQSVDEALEQLSKEKIQLIFLDIAMPSKDGFELLPAIDPKNTWVIFTTAYDQYAIKAIKANALDYILKPIDIDELQMAINKAILKIEEGKISLENRQQLLQNKQLKPENSKKITLPGAQGSKIIAIHQIIRIEADSNYSTFYILQEAPITVAKSIKEYEEILPQDIFFRVHKSSIVNLNFIKNYNKSDFCITLQNEDKISVSRRRNADFWNN